MYDHFDLQAVIWHHGDTFEHGHYTCDVNIDGAWYHINDTTYNTSDVTFESKPGESRAPYIILYKKRIKKSTGNISMNNENDS